jgi:hypothetical protein
MTAVLAESVTAALKTVIDPELGYNIVDLGLVYAVEAADGGVRIVLTTTTPGCPATGSRGHDDLAAALVARPHERRGQDAFRGRRPMMRALARADGVGPSEPAADPGGASARQGRGPRNDHDPKPLCYRFEAEQPR